MFGRLLQSLMMPGFVADSDISKKCAFWGAECGFTQGILVYNRRCALYATFGHGRSARPWLDHFFGGADSPADSPADSR
jgi:hypothetical protein